MATPIFDTDEARSGRMSRQRRQDTTPEVRLRQVLHARGLRFFIHRRPLPDLRRTADIVFPRLRIAVFVDGCFWHGCPEHGNVPRVNTWYWPDKIQRNRDRDADTDRRLHEAGWLSVRIWEHEAPVTAAAHLERLVAIRRAAARPTSS